MFHNIILKMIQFCDRIQFLKSDVIVLVVYMENGGNIFLGILDASGASIEQLLQRLIREKKVE